MLPSSGRSIGEQSTTVLPSNRSIVLADSRFRKENQVESPYDFNCDLSGTAIYAKELYYQKLFWNQPLFSHNNSNCELRFRMNGNDSITYVVYVTPFIMFHEYDGNPPGTSLLTPQPYSYAANLELGLNGDVRTVPLNTTLVNGDGYIRDPFDAGHNITLRFRYSPTRGFCIYPVQDSTSPGYYYSIKLVDCSYISGAHFVHGFGVYDPNTSELKYVPNDFFSTIVWSDTTPNLLPSRYIVIQSPELNKDRRLISFHNGNFANFVNELGIFSVNPARTGVFHEVGVGDDATVISMRDEYTPQSFRIQILDERGSVMACDDPLGNLLQSQGVRPDYVNSYIDGPLAGRGNPNFMDFLVFGYVITRTGLPLTSFAPLEYLDTPPTGMKSASMNAQYINDSSPQLVPSQINLRHCLPLVVNATSLLGPGGIYPVQKGVGFNPFGLVNLPFTPIPGPPSDPYSYNFTKFTWYPYLNPFPYVRWNYLFSIQTFLAASGKAYIYLVMFDAKTFQVIMTNQGFEKNLTGLPPGYDSPPINNSTMQAPRKPWVYNSAYTIPPSPATVEVGFALVWGCNTPSYSGTLEFFYDPPSAFLNFAITNENRQINTQIDYQEPAVEDGKFAFGDPLADAMCEEVIHEIAAVLEYN